MKSVFEGLTGCYITDAEMREAMVLVGYKPDRLNRYKVRFANAPEIPTAFLNPRERIRRAKYGRV